MDNRDKGDKDSGLPGAVISSRLIVEQFGGLEGLARGLRTDLRRGLSEDDRARAERIKAFGVNSFPPLRIKTVWQIIAANFEDPINIVLLCAAVVSVTIGLLKEGFPEGLIEGTSIMIALVIIVVVTSANNWISEKQLAKLFKLQD